MWSYEHRAKGFTPPYGVPPPTAQEQAPTAPFLRFALLILPPSENGGLVRRDCSLYNIFVTRIPPPPTVPTYSTAKNVE